MKPNSFQAFFDKFRADFAAVHGEHPAIAIDGKEMRRSFDKAAGATTSLKPSFKDFEARLHFKRYRLRLLLLRHFGNNGETKGVTYV